MARKKPTATIKAAAPNPTKATPKLKKPVTKQRNRRKKNDQQSDEQLQELQSHEDQEDGNSQNQISDKQSNNSDDDQNSDSMQSDQDDDEEQSSSITPIKPENFAVKQMQFRQRRGTKMNQLMTRKKQQQQDPFWAEHKGYFGDLNMSDDEDQEDYVEDSEGKDQFDSDFGDTQSEHDDEPGEDEKKMVDELDDDKQKQKRRRAELMKKINGYKQKQKTEKNEKPQKTQKQRQKQKQGQKQKQKQRQRSDKKQKSRVQPKTEPPIKKQKSDQKITDEIGNRYIHQVFTQQQLLGEAAHTQYYNWLSLKKLISIETQKKDFTRKVRHVDGSKVIYRNRVNEEGVAATTYELDGVAVNHISQLTHFWQAN